MSSSVSPYAALPPIRSSLFHNPPDTLPPADELEILRLELEAFKAQSLERARKAGDDIRTIEESMRRLKEKEKGKAKAIQKAERERGLTPSVNGDESRASAQPSSQPPRNRLSAAPAPPVLTPTPSFTDVRKSSLASEELKKNKKKKRKREDSSDIEPDPPKLRKPSPLPPPPPPQPQASSSTHSHPPPPPPPPPKASKFPSASSSLNKPSVAADFAIPPSTSLLPSRPPIAPRPVAGPSKPAEVTEDFSKSKQPNQVLVTTFYTSIEPWLRPIKEEDIGFLQYTADEVEPFVMPKLGRHYSVQWEEEDIATYGQPLPGTAAMHASMHAPPPSALPRWEPSTLEDKQAALDHYGHGSLTERVASALLPMNHLLEYRGVKATEEDMAGRPGTNGAAAAAARDKLNVADLEERMRHVVRYHGLLDEIPDYSEAVDDPIATALRHAQRELRTVLATNKARRARLAAIAEDRLAYQEYVESRDAIDKSIITLYSKLQKKDGPKVNKKKKQKSIDLPGGVNGMSGPTGTAALPPCPAALGLSPDEHNQLHIPEQLNDLVRTRRNWVDIVGGVFDEKERENPGRIWGFPQESVYQGVDEEVRAQLERLGPAQSKPSGSGPRVNGVGYAHTNGRANGVDARTSTSYGSKGKARAGDEMDLG